MSLTVGTNSYATVDESDTYFADRFGGEVWIALTSTLKAQLLISATDIQDSSFSWFNSKTDDDQSLEQPRNDETTVDQKIKNAQCELALELYLSQGALLLDNPKLIKTDKVTTEFFESTDAFPKIVTSLLKEFGTLTLSGDIQVISLLR